MTLTCYLVLAVRKLRTIFLLIIMLVELTVNHFDTPSCKIPKTYLQINIIHVLLVLIHPRTGHEDTDGE